MAKPVGRRGSWFADWKGESLPCVHECWCRPGKGTLSYLDPHVGDDPKWSPFIAAIRSGEKVILTRDELGADGQPFRRLSYIATYGVKDVQVEGTNLAFQFVERLDNFT
ncbi:hypothetical protein FM111_08580 [Brevundimonas diminuta 3F5N]|uniref:Uncharacterized protein n=1 Tax=Brevundimonas diminuta 3F5N TaxID=1255603 RepID=A0A1R4G1F1_BREDI|nr:hypothetical protein [Brevundimonas diminuta]SJM61917.1 hypothetical protein FM111_08580 [Brevundimonas diminuta 3F5N]